MRKEMRGLIALSLTFIMSTLVACATPVLTQEDEAGIYAAVVRQLYTVDHTFGSNPPNWPIIYLVRGRGVVEAETARAGSPHLSPSVRAAVVAALTDLPAETKWIDSADDVFVDSETGQVEGNGAIITLGKFDLQGDGSVQVEVSLYFANLGGAGMTYIVEKVDGIWKVTGDTGARWIS